MGSDPTVPVPVPVRRAPQRSTRPLLSLLSLLLACAGSTMVAKPAVAQAATPMAGIYTCTDDRNRRLTADRPIAECTGREQQILNRDGSLKAILPATMTAEERARREARERATAEERAARSDAVRRDRNLIQRYPNEDAHRRSRESALDTARLAVRAGETRLRELAAERKPLLEEAEFYLGKSLPGKLRAAIDANDAASEAQRAATDSLQAEMGRINRLYDAELERLRRLWAGEPAGSFSSGGAGSGLSSASGPARLPLR